jgi:hypothetical protein
VQTKRSCAVTLLAEDHVLKVTKAIAMRNGKSKIKKESLRSFEVCRVYAVQAWRMLHAKVSKGSMFSSQRAKVQFSA